MHPSLVRVVPHTFTIFFVDPTVRGEKKEKKKKETRRPRRKGEERAKTTDVNDFSQPRPLCT